MYTYLLKFSNGLNVKATTKNLDEAQDKCIPFLKEEGDKVEITSPTGKKFTITKKANIWHPIHNGFLFNS